MPLDTFQIKYSSELDNVRMVGLNNAQITSILGFLFRQWFFLTKSTHADQDNLQRTAKVHQ